MTRPLTLIMVAMTCLIANPVLAASDTSVCYGTTRNGRLHDGVKLPANGKNFSTYSSLAGLLGRTYVHGSVYDVVLAAYTIVAKSAPGKTFVYGETGKKNGGPFRPHKTHQNGLSVDFMIPVINAKGESVSLPTSPLNKFGYSIEFDGKGRWKEYTIDFDAMAEHLLALQQAAQQRNVGIWRVIFDPKLQPLLFATEPGKRLPSILKFSKKRSWVRHDEHYHVDFEVACEERVVRP